MTDRFIPPQCSYCWDGKFLAEKAETPEAGNPRRHCPHCGHMYFDNRIGEPALLYCLEEPPKPRYKRQIVATVVYLLLILYILCMTITSGMTNEAIVYLLILLVGLIYSCFRLYGEWEDHRHPQKYKARYMAAKMPYLNGQKKHSDAFASSLHRLFDEDYLYEMISFGADVPDFFFERLGIRKDPERVRAALVLYADRQSYRSRFLRYQQLQEELERYENFLSLGMDSLAFRKEAELLSMTPSRFEAYCQNQQAAIRKKLNEL